MSKVLTSFSNNKYNPNEWLYTMPNIVHAEYVKYKNQTQIQRNIIYPWVKNNTHSNLIQQISHLQLAFLLYSIKEESKPQVDS